MKLYIIITYDIHPVGGTQAYTTGKCEYLDKHGWDTAVFFGGSNERKPIYLYLNKYLRGGTEILYSVPPFGSKLAVKFAVKYLLSLYNIKPNRYKEIIVESHFDRAALWGECIAKYLNARHICLICNEIFTPPKLYAKYLDFFKYKYDRNELFGIHQTSIKRLLQGGYEDVPFKQDHIFSAYPYTDVQDVDSDKVNGINKYEWNIIHFGRCQKGYFERMLQDINTFANIHLDKRIQIIFIGNINEKRNLVHSTIASVPNISIVELGDMSPVPKKVFDIADVVIATAGCAMWSYLSGAKTIVADTKNYLANGLLGYDTDSELIAENESTQQSYAYYLEKVLVEKAYNDADRHILFSNYIVSDKKLDNRYDEHFDLLKLSREKKQYYDIKNFGVRYTTKQRLYYYLLYHPKTMQKLKQLRTSLRWR